MMRVIVITILVSFCISIDANEYSDYITKDRYSQSTYGGIGLIMIPTARSSNDGELGFGISAQTPFNRIYGRMQFFPWMEATLRYTEGEFAPYSYVGSPQTWKDKGVDFKFRFLEENASFPEIAFGLIDIGGSGAYSSEYIVASKRVNNIDWTLGLGWGELGGVNHMNNIFGWFDKDRRSRKGSKQGGGTLNVDRFFSGKNTSIFGGIEYFTPINNLSLKLEYDTTEYKRTVGQPLDYFKKGEIFQIDSRINYALNYQMHLDQRQKLDLSIGFLRGNTLYANASVRSNLNFSGNPKTIIGPEKIRNTNLPAKSFEGLDQNRKNFLTNRIIREMANIGFVTHSIIFNDKELIAEISQVRFLETDKFIDLASRVLANNAMQNIEVLTIVNIDSGIETLRTSVDRNDLKKAVSIGPLPLDLLAYNNYSDLLESSQTIDNDFLYPNLYWEIRPHLNHTLQHQEQFFFWQLEAILHSEYSIKKGLYLTTDIGINIANNYDNYTYHIPDGQLYHVRQDRRLYLTEGKNGMRRMVLDYLLDINQNLKAKISLGYLEWMYGGVGGEILYFPDHKRWALGFDAHWVKQREFDQRFSFKDYETFTGFLSYYQDIPIYDMRLKVSAGKFLGKDIGAMIDVSRRFTSGARVGAFATFTDCDSACVGEGSFHKGIYFEMPLDLFYVQSTTRKRTSYAWAPLTKDAGARLDTGSLYNVVISAKDEMEPLRLKPWSLKKILKGFSTANKSEKNS